MRNTKSAFRPLAASEIVERSSKSSRSLEDLLAPLDALAAHSASLVVNRDAHFDFDGQNYTLPRYNFVGPHSGDAPIRLGIFAGVHGDEPEGVFAAVRFLTLLEKYPEIATGYYVSVYPVCNPTGFEDNTRHSRGGKDLNREFWLESKEPEVRLLETELLLHSFNGIIALHVDDTADGFYGFVGGTTLSKHLLSPALDAADSYLPLDTRSVIDGFPARKAVVKNGFPGVLRPPPAAKPQPFDIILEAPSGRPAYLTELAFVAALQSIFGNYRKFISYARDL